MQPRDQVKVKRIKTFAEFLRKAGVKRILTIYGGAGSGKSVATAQHICQLACQSTGVSILVVRKTLPSLRITAYKQVREMLEGWGVPFGHNKTERTIQVGKNQIYFTGLDDREKIKSSEFNYIWIEEATDLDREDFMQLNLRLRRQHPDGKTNQMFMTFNPVDEYHWLILDIVRGPKNPKIQVHHSSYKDNPFLDQDYRDELEDLINKDENYYRIYCLGEPGVLKNIIYSNYTVEEFPAQIGLMIRDADCFGLDFGFNNKMALIAVKYYDGEPYIKELVYESGWTTNDLIDWMKNHIYNRTIPIYADSAEPDRIEDIKRAGFNVHPAKKAVVPGIDYCKGQHMHIDQDSPKTVAELRSYKWREDRDGRVLDEPVKYNDHSMDAIRYALYTMQIGAAKAPVEHATGGKKVPWEQEATPGFDFPDDDDPVLVWG